MSGWNEGKIIPGSCILATQEHQWIPDFKLYNGVALSIRWRVTFTLQGKTGGLVDIWDHNLI